MNSTSPYPHTSSAPLSASHGYSRQDALKHHATIGGRQGSSSDSANLSERVFLKSESPLRHGATFFHDEFIILCLRNSKTCGWSWLSRRKQEEAAIDGVNEAIDSIANTAVVLVADWFPEGEIPLEW